MPKTEPVTVYVDLLNVEEVKSMMQDAATEIGALRSRAHDLAAAIQEHDSLDECARCQAALAAFDLLLIDGPEGGL